MIGEAVQEGHELAPEIKSARFASCAQSRDAVAFPILYICAYISTDAQARQVARVNCSPPKNKDCFDDQIIFAVRQSNP